MTNIPDDDNSDDDRRPLPLRFYLLGAALCLAAFLAGEPRLLSFVSAHEAAATGNASSAQTAPCPEFLLAPTAAKAGFTTHDLSGDGGVLHVKRKPLLTLADFTDANVSLTEGQVVLNVGLKPPASKRWMEFTRGHVGATVAFISGGKLIKAAKIKDPNTGSGFLIGPFEKDEADSLAAAINSGCKG